MIRRRFGKGPEVSLFTLGTMRATNSKDQMLEVLEAAILAGINHIETAPAYGFAENFLGKSIKELKQKGLEPIGGWVITSKIIPGGSLNQAKQQLRGILSRLGLKRIDNLAIHGLNLSQHLNWAINGPGAELFNWAHSEGFIGQYGFSSHGPSSLIKKALASKQFDFCSLHLHLFDQERIPIAEKALQEGIGVMAISPADKGGHLQNPSQTLVDDCFPVSPIEMAYRFLLGKGISTLTVGAFEAKDLNLAKNLARSNGPINKTEELILENLQKQSSIRLGESKCGQCMACLPCPQEVPIPELLRLRNLFVGHDLRIYAKERYNLIGKAGHWSAKLNATACNECGECLPKCPNHLAIPDLLKETHKSLIDKPRRRLWG